MSRLSLLTILVTLLCLTRIFAQEEKIFKVYPTAGITWRSTAMNFFNFDAVIPADPTKPYNYERNVQGLGINPGLQLQFKLVGVEYYPSLRYDVIHSDVHIENKYTKGFLIDHNINLFVKRKILYGVGFSIVNDNEVYSFVNPTLRYHNLEFKTYNFFVTVPIIKKIMQLEIKALYVPKDFPENPDEDYIMYSLRAYYKFDFLNKPKK